MLGKPLSSELEEPSIDCAEEGTSEEEGTLLAWPLGQAAAEVEPTASDSAEGATGQVTETTVAYIPSAHSAAGFLGRCSTRI